MKKYLFIMMCILLAFAWVGCGSDGVDDNIEKDTPIGNDSTIQQDSTLMVNAYFLQNYSVKVVEMGQLPSWLVERIDFYSDPRRAPYIYVFCAYGQNGMIYFIDNPYSSSIYNELYDAQGTKINIFEGDEKFQKNLVYLSSLDWVCIYILKNSK